MWPPDSRFHWRLSCHRCRPPSIAVSSPPETRTAKWATTRRDGRPHVVPVWFILEGDDLLITTASKSVKGRAVLRDPRVALCIDDDRPPYAFVLIEGRVTISTDPDEVLRATTPRRCCRRTTSLVDKNSPRS
ncbi:PPOX class F420-dependent oxidoreductase [[Mycobacterium] manitobense]|uniref:PPOX class F420-dependent oxidoreductase n=1 Tax=[Mycobacterium] manitobense TaxID=190147 RepID=UPI0021F2C5F4|nr:PPOX class F420-dependent oxidoreductase [[Mycobacterium] manitobense]